MKNSLVMYKGGGYDGCYWEWNYAYIDGTGKFYNIASTGRKGCETLETLQAAYSARPKDFDIYPLATDADRFSAEAPISHLIGVARWFAENIPEIRFSVKCDECGQSVPVVQAEGDGLHGCGGIAMEYRQILCCNCEVCN